MTGLRERSKLRRRKLVVDAAEKLFREKGYVGTTIENIASSADVSIGSLYSAFGSKGGIMRAVMQPVIERMKRDAEAVIEDPPKRGVAAILALLDAYRFTDDWRDLRLLSVLDQRAAGQEEDLEKLVEDFATGAEEVVLAASRDESLTHRERLAAATFNLTHRVLQNAIRFRVLERNESSLSGDLAKWHHEAKRRSLTALSELIARGIEGGEFEQVTAQIAALNVFAMCNGTAWWFRPGGSRTAEQIATIVSDMAVRMISRPPELASANSKEAILQRLHADIDVLAGLASKTD